MASDRITITMTEDLWAGVAQVQRRYVAEHTGRSRPVSEILRDAARQGFTTLVHLSGSASLDQSSTDALDPNSPAARNLAAWNAFARRHLADYSEREHTSDLIQALDDILEGDEKTFRRLREWQVWASHKMGDVESLDTDDELRVKLSKRLSEGLKAYMTGDSSEEEESPGEASEDDYRQESQAWVRMAYRLLGTTEVEIGRHPSTPLDGSSLRDDVSRVWDRLTVDASHWKAEAIRAGSPEKGHYLDLTADQDWNIWANNLVGLPETIPEGDAERREDAQRRVESKMWQIADWTSWAMMVLGMEALDPPDDYLHLPSETQRDLRARISHLASTQVDLGQELIKWSDLAESRVGPDHADDQLVHVFARYLEATEAEAKAAHEDEGFAWNVALREWGKTAEEVHEHVRLLEDRVATWAFWASNLLGDTVGEAEGYVRASGGKVSEGYVRADGPLSELRKRIEVRLEATDPDNGWMKWALGVVAGRGPVADEELMAYLNAFKSDSGLSAREDLQADIASLVKCSVEGQAWDRWAVEKLGYDDREQREATSADLREDLGKALYSLSPDTIWLRWAMGAIEGAEPVDAEGMLERLNAYVGSSGKPEESAAEDLRMQLEAGLVPMPIREKLHSAGAWLTPERASVCLLDVMGGRAENVAKLEKKARELHPEWFK